MQRRGTQHDLLGKTFIIVHHHQCINISNLTHSYLCIFLLTECKTQIETSNSFQALQSTLQTAWKVSDAYKNMKYSLIKWFYQLIPVSSSPGRHNGVNYSNWILVDHLGVSKINHFSISLGLLFMKSSSLIFRSEISYDSLLAQSNIKSWLSLGRCMKA